MGEGVRKQTGSTKNKGEGRIRRKQKQEGTGKTEEETRRNYFTWSNNESIHCAQLSVFWRTYLLLIGVK